MAQVSVDLGAGTATVAGLRIAVCEDPEGLRLGDRDGPLLRALTFAERRFALHTAGGCPDPVDALARAAARLALRENASYETARYDPAVLECLALHLAGAHSTAAATAPALAAAALAVVRATGWSPADLDATRATTVDDLARALLPAPVSASADDGWTRLELAPGTVGDVRAELAGDLLTRAAPPSPGYTAAALGPFAPRPSTPDGTSPPAPEAIAVESDLSHPAATVGLGGVSGRSLPSVRPESQAPPGTAAPTAPDPGAAAATGTGTTASVAAFPAAAPAPRPNPANPLESDLSHLATTVGLGGASGRSLPTAWPQAPAQPETTAPTAFDTGAAAGGTPSTAALTAAPPATPANPRRSDSPYPARTLGLGGAARRSFPPAWPPPPAHLPPRPPAPQTSAPDPDRPGGDGPVPADARVIHGPWPHPPAAAPGAPGPSAPGAYAPGERPRDTILSRLVADEALAARLARLLHDEADAKGIDP